MNTARRFFLISMTALRYAAINTIYHRANRALSVFVFILLFWSVVFIFMMHIAAENHKRLNRYIPINEHGVAIAPVRGTEPLLSRAEVEDFVRECMHKAFALSPGNYRREYMRFTMSCMAPSDAVVWGEQLRTAGYFELLKTGSVLNFKPKSISVVRDMVNNGRHMWLVEVNGEIERIFMGIDSAELNIRVVVMRQDPFNYEHAVSIKQVIL